MKNVKVAAAIIRDGDRILSCQRSYGEFKDGWEFPGGKLEEGETGEQAAVREIQEELGVAVCDLDYLCTVEHDYETFHLSMQCYLCRIAQGTIEERVHENMAWLDTAHLWDVDWLPADVAVVKELEKAIGREG
jgi:8-oxo-dGTP diphosphatase